MDGRTNHFEKLVADIWTVAMNGPKKDAGRFRGGIHQ